MHLEGYSCILPMDERSQGVEMYYTAHSYNSNVYQIRLCTSMICFSLYVMLLTDTPLGLTMIWWGDWFWHWQKEYCNASWKSGHRRPSADMSLDTMSLEDNHVFHMYAWYCCCVLILNVQQRESWRLEMALHSAGATMAGMSRLIQNVQSLDAPWSNTVATWPIFFESAGIRESCITVWRPSSRLTYTVFHRETSELAIDDIFFALSMPNQLSSRHPRMNIAFPLLSLPLLPRFPPLCKTMFIYHHLRSRHPDSLVNTRRFPAFFRPKPIDRIARSVEPPLLPQAIGDGIPLLLWAV